MHRSPKSDGSPSSLPACLLARGDSAVRTALRLAKQRAFLPSTEWQDEAARAFTLEHDEASFTVLYLAAQTPMTRAVRRAGVHRADVEDVVSIAGAAIWFAREHYDGPAYGQFVGYAVTVARSKAMDWHKERDRFKRIPTNRKVSDERLKNLAGHGEPSPEDVAATREAVGKLSPQQQTVVRMQYEGWSFEEIGQAIGCEKKYVRVIFLDAVERLQQMVA